MTAVAQSALKPLTESKLPNVLLKGQLRFAKVKLDSALNGSELNLRDADFVFFDESSTAQTGATYSIDDESGPQLPAGPLRGFYDLPCKRLYFTCAALAGGVLNVWYGKGVRLLGVTPSGKGQWYDRNPTNIVKTYNAAGVAPHVDTQRWTYTVPAGRKAIIEAVLIEILRTSPSSTGAQGEINAYLIITPNGGAAANYAILRMRDGNLGAEKNVHFGQGGILLAGDNMYGGTNDQSSDGTVTYSISMKVSEFDA